MIATILSFLGGAWGKVAGIGAAVLGVLLVGWRIIAGVKNSGRNEQRLEDANAGLKARLDAKERVEDAQADVDSLTAEQRLERLRANTAAARSGTARPER